MVRKGWLIIALAMMSLNVSAQDSLEIKKLREELELLKKEVQQLRALLPAAVQASMAQPSTEQPAAAPSTGQPVTAQPPVEQPLTAQTVDTVSVAPAPQEKKPAKTNWLQNLTSRITINGYAQGGYAHNDMGPDAMGNKRSTSDFNLKRTLVWVRAQITDRWSFLFMHNFSSVVQEYYTDFRVTNNHALTVRVGQFKNSLTLENPMSPSQLELIDVCSQSVNYLAGCGGDPFYGTNYGRDLGLKIYGELFNSHLLYEVALMNGQGVNRRDGNKHKDVIVKLDYRPINGLRLVASGQLGKGHSIYDASVNPVAWNPTIQLGDDYTRNRYSVGFEYKFGSYGAYRYKEARPISLRGEWLEGKDGDVKSRGAYLTTCIPLYKGLDAIGSFDWFDRNINMKYDQTNFTVGLQYWFYKKCRIQMQYTHSWRQFDCDYNNLQAQFQVAF